MKEIKLEIDINIRKQK